MTLSKLFWRAACAGIGAFATATAIAAIPKLPLAEDALVEQGIDPHRAAQIVKSLAGTNAVRILTRDSMDEMIAGLAEETSAAKQRGENDVAVAYAQMTEVAKQVRHKQEIHGDFLLAASRQSVNFLQTLKPEHAARAKAECYIYLPPQTDTRNAIASFTDIPADYIEAEIVSARDLRLAKILHELAHCPPGDVDAGEARESRADLLSLKIMKDLSRDPDFIKKYTLLRILTPNFTTHNTGPFIDAETHSLPPVTYPQILRLYEDLMRRHNEKIEHMDMNATTGKPFFLSAARVFNAILKDPPVDLAPLTRRFMELYVEGTKAIAPKAAAYSLK